MIPTFDLSKHCDRQVLADWLAEQNADSGFVQAFRTATSLHLALAAAVGYRKCLWAQEVLFNYCGCWGSVSVYQNMITGESLWPASSALAKEKGWLVPLSNQHALMRFLDPPLDDISVDVLMGYWRLGQGNTIFLGHQLHQALNNLGIPYKSVRDLDIVKVNRWAEVTIPGDLWHTTWEDFTSVWESLKGMIWPMSEDVSALYRSKCLFARIGPAPR